MQQLGECVETILTSEAVQGQLRHGMSAQDWVEGYLQRPETHP